ncbi:MAG: beta-ketoacyl synthase N-terminal-like domain-containing protein [Acidimicrobiales bacterium]
MRTRVVVTGLGTLSPDGRGVDAFWEAIVAPVDRTVRQSIEGFDYRPWLTFKEQRRSAPFTRHAVVAADEAVIQAGRPVFDPVRTGVVLSTVYGALETVEEQARVHDEEGAAEVFPFLGALACENAPASALCLRYGIRGPAKAVVGACAGAPSPSATPPTSSPPVAATWCWRAAAQGAMTPAMVASYDNPHVLARAFAGPARSTGAAMGSCSPRVPPCSCSSLPTTRMHEVPDRSPSWPVGPTPTTPATW